MITAQRYNSEVTTARRLRNQTCVEDFMEGHRLTQDYGDGERNDGVEDVSVASVKRHVRVRKRNKRCVLGV